MVYDYTRLPCDNSHELIEEQRSLLATARVGRVVQQFVDR